VLPSFKSSASQLLSGGTSFYFPWGPRGTSLASSAPSPPVFLEEKTINKDMCEGIK